MAFSLKIRDPLSTLVGQGQVTYVFGAFIFRGVMLIGNQRGHHFLS